MQDVIAITIVLFAASFLAYQAWSRLRRDRGSSCGNCGSCSEAGTAKALPLVEISLERPLERRKTAEGRLTSAPAHLSETWTTLAERWLEYTVDLSNVETPQALEKALFDGLGITPDDVKQPWSPNAIHALWATYQSATNQEKPHDGKIIHFVGWSQFANRMPRYARRLRSLLGSYSKSSPYALQLEFE